MIFQYLLVASLALFLFGCQTMHQIQDSKGDEENIGEILSAVSGALRGKQLSEEELRNLEKQIRTDKDAQTAVQAITDSVGGKVPQVKYCPVTGKRYAAHLEICPEHQVRLEIVSP